MGEDALIRLENLRATKLGPSELSLRAGGRSSYWSDMLAGKKSFGEKAARKIEEALGMPRGALDKPGSAEPVQAMPDASTPLTTAAMELGIVFDRIPVRDVVRRAEAHSLAMQAILSVLRREP